MVANQQPHLFYVGLHGEDAQVDHVGIVGPGNNARDDNHRQPLEDRHTKAAQPTIGGNVHTTHSDV